MSGFGSPPGERVSVGQSLSGEMVPSQDGLMLWSAGSTRLLQANRFYFQRFVPKRPRSLTLAQFEVTTAATANDVCEVAIYAGEAGGSRLATTGETSGKLNPGTVPALSTLTLSVDVDPGEVYYVGLRCGPVGGTAATLLAAGINTGALAGFGDDVPNILSFVKIASVAGDALPATLPLKADWASPLSSWPVLWLREV